jgi:hypothetical protein
MASGDPLFTLLLGMGNAPADNAPSLGLVTSNISGEDNGLVHVLEFDAAAIEHMDFPYVLPDNYGGGGLTFAIRWSAASATTAETRWEIAIRRVQDDAEDLDTTAHSYAYNFVEATAPSAVGELSYDDVTFTDGADMDSWAVGEYAIIRVRRNATHANDDMAGDALFHAIYVTET